MLTLAAVLLALALSALAQASATDIYISQAGGGNGSSCSSAQSVNFFNSTSNWGSGSSQIGPGTTVHLCGILSTLLGINGSGTSGNVIKLLWESGAKVSLPVGSAFNLGGHSYLLFDGGAACGPSTACSSTDAGTGIIENTANGSLLANHSTNVYAFDGTGGSSNVEVRNLIIRNLYVHTNDAIGLADAPSSIDTNTGLFYANPFGTGWYIHDSTEHDMGTCFQLQGFVDSSTIEIARNYCYNMDWGVGLAGSGTRTALIHDNHWGGTSSWNTTSNAFHHDGLHFYMATSATSIRTEVYNNLFDGNWEGNTTTFIYQENAAPNNWDLYNNVFIQNPGTSWNEAIITATSENGEWSNNTIICGGWNQQVALWPSAKNLITGTVNFRNNLVVNCGTFIQLYQGTVPPGIIDNNVYMQQATGGSPAWGGWGGTNSLSTWQATCNCDLHSVYTPINYVNAGGVPIAGYPGFAAGANLSSLGLAAFNFGSSDGGTIPNPPSRPAGAWDIGAYQSGSATPPVCLNACDINCDGADNVADVQSEINMALQKATCTNPSGTCNVTSVQKVINAALGGTCVAP